jgi:hypothetical protein
MNQVNPLAKPQVSNAGSAEMNDPFDQLGEGFKNLFDGLSVITVLGTLIDMLPSIAALFTIIWTAIRIYETDTVRRILGRKDNPRKK